jgi:hypothetical protein
MYCGSTALQSQCATLHMCTRLKQTSLCCLLYVAIQESVSNASELPSLQANVQNHYNSNGCTTTATAAATAVAVAL